MKSLTSRDQATLAGWLRTRRTLHEVESINRLGLVGNARFSERTRDWFKFLWTWSAPRFAGPEGRRHGRAWDRLGRLKYDRRIERVQKLVQRLEGAHDL